MDGFRLREKYLDAKLYQKPVPVKPDRRVTLYWNPELKTNAEGKAHIEFFNSDLSRSYYVTVSGTDSNGKIVHYEGLLK